MKRTITKVIVAGFLTLSMLLSGIVVPDAKFASSFVETVLAGEIQETGGRQDITLGNHNNTIMVTAQLSKETRIQMWDKNWNSVWAGTYSSGTHVLYCGSDVYTVTFYLDLDKMAHVKW